MGKFLREGDVGRGRESETAREGYRARDKRGRQGETGETDQCRGEWQLGVGAMFNGCGKDKHAWLSIGWLKPANKDLEYPSPLNSSMINETDIKLGHYLDRVIDPSKQKLHSGNNWGFFLV